MTPNITGCKEVGGKFHCLANKSALRCSTQLICMTLSVFMKQGHAEALEAIKGQTIHIDLKGYALHVDELWIDDNRCDAHKAA